MTADTHDVHLGAAGVPEFLIFHHNDWMHAKYVWLAFGILFIGFVLPAKLAGFRLVPGRLQGAFEFLYEWLHEAMISIMGEKGIPYFPLFISLFIFILFNNLLGLIPGMASGTASLNVTVALALVTFAATHVLGMKKKGVIAYWGHFFNILDSSKEKGPIRLLVAFLQYILLPFIELIGELARPLSLSMRLFGNIFAKEVLLAVLAYMAVDYVTQGGLFNYAMLAVPALLRPGILILGVLVSIIQAVVFTALSMVYIGGAIEMHDHHDEVHAENDSRSETAAA